MKRLLVMACVVGGFFLLPGSSVVAGIAPIISAAAEANHVLKSSGGNLHGFSVTTGADAGYVLIFNATSAPSDGAVTPVKCYQVAANSTLGVVWPTETPLYLDTGITISFSTTGCFQKTSSATAFISGEVQ